MQGYLRVAALGAFLLAATGARGQAADPMDDHSGDLVGSPYAFSDELGGFAIAGVSGIGTRDDPIRITQDYLTVAPATLVIRAIRPINPFGVPGPFATGTLHIVLDVRNGSGTPWVGFELELQERYREPSVYGDGLSFDQRRQEAGSARSDAFRSARTDYEPFDRLLFEDGALDPDAVGEFRFLITDLTPLAIFYVRLDPHVPAS